MPTPLDINVLAELAPHPPEGALSDPLASVFKPPDRLQGRIAIRDTVEALQRDGVHQADVRPFAPDSSIPIHNNTIDLERLIIASPIARCAL